MCLFDTDLLNTTICRHDPASWQDTQIGGNLVASLRIRLSNVHQHFILPSKFHVPGFKTPPSYNWISAAFFWVKNHCLYCSYIPLFNRMCAAMFFHQILFLFHELPVWFETFLKHGYAMLCCREMMRKYATINQRLHYCPIRGLSSVGYFRLEAVRIRCKLLWPLYTWLRVPLLWLACD